MNGVSIREIKNSWSMIWVFLQKLTPVMLAMTVSFIFASGILTIYGMKYLNLSEANTLLHPLIDRFGVESLIAFDALASLIIAGIYMATRKLEYISTIFVMIFYVMMFLNFLNDFGYAFGITQFQGILKVTDMFKILRR